MSVFSFSRESLSYHIKSCQVAIKLIAPVNFVTDRNSLLQSFGNQCSGRLFLHDGNRSYDRSLINIPTSRRSLPRIHTFKRYVMLLACFAARITSYQSNSRARRAGHFPTEAAPPATRMCARLSKVTPIARWFKSDRILARRSRDAAEIRFRIRDTQKSTQNSLNGKNNFAEISKYLVISSLKESLIL